MIETRGLSVSFSQWVWLYRRLGILLYASPQALASLREAKVRILEIGPLHKFLEKR